MAEQARRRAVAAIDGVITALVTPFTDSGRLDTRAYDRHVAALLDAGVDGFFVAGTTGEGAYLTTHERRELVERAVRVSSSKAIVCAAILRPNTAEVVQELDGIFAAGADYVVVVAPFYYAVSQEAIAAHFTQIADASPVPIIIYDIPGNTHNPIEPATVRRLAGHPNIAGLKDSSGVFAKMTELLCTSLPEGFSVIEGEDTLDAPAMLMGADAVVSGLSNVDPRPFKRIIAASRNGHIDHVRAAQSEVFDLAGLLEVCGGDAVGAVKAVLEMRGTVSRCKREPLRSVDDEVFALLRSYAERHDFWQA